MLKINIDDKINIYGKIDNIDLNIENKKVSEVVKNFYELLLKNNIDISKIKHMRIDKIVVNNKKINKENFFYLRGYAKKKDADEKSMRYYFNIRNIRLKYIYRELKMLYTDYLYYYENNTNNLDIIVEILTCYNKNFNV